MKQGERFDLAAEWAYMESRRRAANPKTVDDVQFGYSVPYSEIRSRFPQLMTDNPVQNRLDFDRAWQRARRRVDRRMKGKSWENLPDMFPIPDQKGGDTDDGT